MVIWAWVVLNHGVALHDLFTFKLHDFVYKGFHNSDAQIIILRPVVVVNDNQILVDRNQEFWHVQLFNQLIHYFIQLEKAFDNKPVHLWK